MGHAFLAPSSAAIWGAPGGCRAAPTLQALYPDREESPEAREGTAAHELAAVFISHALRALQVPARHGQAAGNGVIFDQAMHDAAQVYADDIRTEAVKRGVFGGDDVGVEYKVMTPRIHPLNGGTPDFWMHDRRNRTLLIYDFKYGFRGVDAYENWQLINYAALLLDKLGIDGAVEQGYTVILKVIQPRNFRRSGPVDVWEIAATDLRPYFNDLAQGAAETVQDNPLTRPGSHCLNCSGRHACEGLRKAASAAMDFTQSIATDNLPAPALALELSLLNWAKDVLEARRSGLEQEAESRLAAGEVVPGYSLAPSYGRSAWKDPEQILGIGTAYGLDLRKKEPVTPNQAKAAGLPEDIATHFSYRPAGGMKLKAVKSNDIKKVFSQ